MKEITYKGAEGSSKLVSKNLHYENTGGVERYRIVVNGNQLWDMGVGYRGAGIYKATPGWKVSDNFNKGNDFEKNNIYNINTLYAKLGGKSSLCYRRICG